MFFKIGVLKNLAIFTTCGIALFSFITLVLESRVHGYFVLIFILKFLVSITFARIKNVGIRNNIQYFSDFSL